MTREEQINEMAKEVAAYLTSDKDIQVAFADVLKKGAEWADDHPDIDVRTKAAWKSGYQAAIDAHPHWISVEDELPPKGANILMVSGGLDEPMEGYYKDWNWQRKQHMFHSYIDNATWHNITHWMAMPQRPVVSKMESTKQKGGEI